MSCVAPVSLPHHTTKATRVGEFTFPEKSVFLTNISAIMKDPRFVPKPNVFDPDRFLNEEGRWDVSTISNVDFIKRKEKYNLTFLQNRFVKHERLLPFGIGRRYCMGEPS